MLRQYRAQRFLGGTYPRCIGTVAVGTIVYLQDNVRPFSFPRWTVRKNPWIVTAWLNREYAHPQRPNTFMTGGHLAVVKSLRDGRTRRVADWILLRCLDAGLERLAA